MARVSIHQPAPDFTLPDFEGSTFTLSALRDREHVLLVFNRSFL